MNRAIAILASTSLMLLGHLVINNSNAEAAGLRSTRPIVCGARNTRTVRNVNIHAKGPAIIVKDNCELTLVNCRLSSKGVAVKVLGRGTLNLRNCDVSGGRVALSLREYADINVFDSAIYGRITKTPRTTLTMKRSHRNARPLTAVALRSPGLRVAVGPDGVRVNAGGTRASVGPNGVAIQHQGRGRYATSAHRRGREDVRTEGARVSIRSGNGVRLRVGSSGVSIRTGNGVRVRTGNGAVSVRTGNAGHHVQSARAIPRGLKASGPVICTGSDDVTVRNLYIRASGRAVASTGSCNITLINCHVISTRGAAISTTGSGDIVARNSYIQGKRAAIVLTGSGDVTVLRSTVVGRIRKTGAGDFYRKKGSVLRKR